MGSAKSSLGTVRTEPEEYCRLAKSGLVGKSKNRKSTAERVKKFSQLL
jgi:hypothetical protein